ncbi:ABC transporter permease [Micromonospora sp. DT228]|uniref:ABC transporter permease n=1 Tax=Micromonospora sp. DT228 TaxID=3393443 RepID=UPI003CF7C826
MIQTLHAEWLKLRSTRSPYLCLLSVVAATVLIAAALGSLGRSQHTAPIPSQVLAGLLGYGLIILMVLGGMSVSNEYGNGTIRVSLAVQRGRTRILAAKAVLIAVLSAVVAAALTPVALVVGAAVSGYPIPSTGGVHRLYWGVPLIAALAGAGAVGLAFLIRRTAGLVAVVIIWPLLLEGLASLIPEFGDRIATFLPFANAHFFLGDRQGLPFTWSPTVALIIFTGVVAVLLGAAGWTLNRRDV